MSDAEETKPRRRSMNERMVALRDAQRREVEKLASRVSAKRESLSRALEEHGVAAAELARMSRALGEAVENEQEA